VRWTFGEWTDLGIGFRKIFEGLRKNRGPFHFPRFNCKIFNKMRRIMDLWIPSEIRIRRDDALENARCSRLARLAADGRSFRTRIRIAEVAEAMSGALAAVARSLRNGETV
jgi:hypothetical protein